jgi:hypothetical protein
MKKYYVVSLYILLTAVTSIVSSIFNKETEPWVYWPLTVETISQSPGEYSGRNGEDGVGMGSIPSRECCGSYHGYRKFGLAFTSEDRLCVKLCFSAHSVATTKQLL